MKESLLIYLKFIQYGVGYLAGQIELTSACKQRCTFCKSWKDHVSGKYRAAFRYEKICDILQQLSEIPYFENLTFTGGEPQCWEHLEKLLKEFGRKLPFDLGINTTLVEPINFDLWRNFNSIRVSLDSLNPKTYKILRGVSTNPEIVLKRLEKLSHPNWSVMVCVSENNLEEIPEIIERLKKMRSLPRKVMFLPALGREKNFFDMERYESLIEKFTNQIDLPFQTNFAEDVSKLKKLYDISEVPCSIGRTTFHIKADGDLFPCCLIGGEAIDTHQDFCFGNVYQNTLQEIQNSNMSLPLHYSGKNSPCLKVCQWKQMAMNIATKNSWSKKLSMP